MVEKLGYILKEAGLKNTPARRFILEIFSSDCKPINAEYIQQALMSKSTSSTSSKTVNLVTIYRTLASLEKAGILTKINLRKESAYYELADHHHHHIVCTRCGRTESFNTCIVDTISKDVLKKSSQFKTVDQHSLELFGLCAACYQE